ncbi:MAG: ATP-binding protein [Spirochaetes bacterium]|nr:ATP-binding protein [Spirochaetota bacterium]
MSNVNNRCLFFKIEKVLISGLWNTSNIETKLNEDMNIFIGKNGTGKTTLINILHAALTVDVELLSNYQFTEIKLKLVAKINNKKRQKTIIISKKTSNDSIDYIIYKLSRTNSLNVPLLNDRIGIRRRRLASRFEAKIEEIQNLLNDIVCVSWLSVHRELVDIEELDRYSRIQIQGSNPVDRRLYKLMQLFTEYQLQLQSEGSMLSSQLQKDILFTMLYAPKYDEWDRKKIPTLNFKEMSSALLNTYKELELTDNKTKNAINRHVRVIIKALKNIDNRRRNRDTKISINDIMPVSLFKRTQHILDIATKIQKKKNKLFKPISTYINLLNIEFNSGLKFKISPKNTGELLIYKKDKQIMVNQLSSGQKQLLILLTETLLQINKPYIFMADEPELSIHIEWQRKLLGAIIALNSDAQIIIATHSPEIASKWKNKVKRMEHIING